MARLEQGSPHAFCNNGLTLGDFEMHGFDTFTLNKQIYYSFLTMNSIFTVQASDLTTKVSYLVKTLLKNLLNANSVINIHQKQSALKGKQRWRLCVRGRV